MHNTYAELSAAVLISQRNRLSQTAAGRTILSRVGISPYPQHLDEELVNVPTVVRRQITISPVPRNMYRGCHAERRAARVKWLRKQLESAPNVTYVDAASYDWHKQQGVSELPAFLLISTSDVLPDAAFLCGDTSCSVEVPVNSTQPPIVDNHQFLRQQPWSSTTIINATIFGGGTAYKHFPGEACLGHDTGSGMERLPCLLLQQQSLLSYGVVPKRTVLCV
ncbi:hypothetical protein HPB50_015444 [Hyalomma asiaticum]|uniref:Uncharacterized protein n=1 Tax=Hyalomma asiaticum TaxID=266040 RepID=A0ACB7SWJ0_HYAAI|nr:hypothetical protein HPB50_015444 [Hyalomma asiaticum]